MNNDNNYSRDKDNNTYPADRNRPDINPASRTKEAAGNPDSDKDRKGRNIDIDLENQKNEMSGRSQQTTPQSSAKEIADRFGSREQQNQERSNKQKENS
ncbi:hypothetical protein [Cesiribacter sp. SM1]|uniref:hypothetical protein n=1 Tax=Cesiribacter sp. SM1 TaxID=2861196 RepID=UPI001CD4ACC4|nr:hypothetical protein [Cesiribacter sp. SM1]